MAVDIKMNQSFPRVGPAPSRYSSRKPIFEVQNVAYKMQAANEPDEMYRIVGKIRSLEDDVRCL